jgi:hypothetical protein
MEENSIFVNCVLDVKTSLERELEESRRVIAHKYDLSEPEITDVYRLILVRLAVEFCVKTVPNMTGEEINQLASHVNYLIGGAVHSKTGTLKLNNFEDTTNG